MPGAPQPALSLSKDLAFFETWEEENFPIWENSF
jgi:hypothetical protein